MEVDAATNHHDNSSLLRLAEVAEQLAISPQSIPLIEELWRLSQVTGMQEQGDRALEMLVELKCPEEGVWMKVVNHAEASLQGGKEGGADIAKCLRLIELLAGDHCVIPLLSRAADLLSLEALSAEHEADVRPIFIKLCTTAASDLSHSHLVWDAYLAWELDRLDQLPATDRTPAIMERMHRVFLDRLATPHATHAETAQKYSTFNSTYCAAEEYEGNMIKSTRASAKALQRWNDREVWESNLPPSDGDRTQRLSYLYAYLEMEIDARKGRKPDTKMAISVFERILATLSGWREAEGRAAEAAVWIKYGGWLAATNGITRAQVVEAWKGGVRSCPESGDLWARLLRCQERQEAPAQVVTETYVRALSLGVLTQPSSNGIAALVTLEMAWASYMRGLQAALEDQEEDEDDDDDERQDQVEATLRAGSKNCRQVAAKDPAIFRLEKYLASWLERKGKVDKALEVWDASLKQYGRSYTAWIEYTEFAIRNHELAKARTAFKQAASRHNIDWQEAVLEAWITFETYWGSAESLDAALSRVQSVREANASAAAQAAAAQTQSRLAASRQTEAAPSAEVLQNTTETAAPVEQNGSEAAESDRKRKAEDVTKDEVANNTSDKKKRVRIEEPPAVVENEPVAGPSSTSPAAALQRDREHTTVFVSGLPESVTEQEVRARFKDCGDIREIVVVDKGEVYATVEFMDRSSVPAALTKDKKKIRDATIQVYLAWKSTLFVTNFPEEADDAWIRELFGKYGTILETRWPSKKYKSSRRFVYVQFTSPERAQAAALELNNFEAAPERRMSVLISDPEHKKQRSDANAEACEVYVAGLSKFVEEKDLRRLFSPHGTLKRVDVAKGDDDRCRGFAFLEFESASQAAAALTMDGTELKKRKMSVKPSSRKKKAGEAAAPAASGTPTTVATERRFRLRGLPARAQEGLLEQALAKQIGAGKIKRVEIFEDSREALVELATAADVGNVLLRTDALHYDDDHALTVEAEVILPTVVAPVVPVSAAAAAAPEPSTTGFKPRPPKFKAPKTTAKRRLVVPAAGVTPPKGGDGEDVAMSEPSSAMPAPAPAPVPKGQDDFRRMLLGGK